jgi:hypothetical protein
MTAPDSKTAMLRLTFPASWRLLRGLEDLQGRDRFPSCNFMCSFSFCYNKKEILMNISVLQYFQRLYETSVL